MTATVREPAFDLAGYLECHAENVDRALDKYLPSANLRPESIHDAIRYSMFAGGKRLRPILAIAVGEACGAELDVVMPVACGLEMLHVYSMIHDDLPCMDDDDLRRGKLTLHKVYGEALAILAGDALNAMAFEMLVESGDTEIVKEVAQAVGTLGMIGGQVVDVESEGCDVTGEDVEYIHRRKTAALIRVSLWSGARVAGADEQTIQLFSDAGWALGMAYQIIDDVLDVIGTPEQLGKASGADEIHQKATFPKVFGLDESRRQAEEYADEAKANLIATGAEVSPLCTIADYIVTRYH